jgi:group II intron reverse transcriptase/maturase
VVGDKARAERQRPESAAVGPEESDAGILPKRPGKAWVTPVVPEEGRPAAKGKVAEGNACRTQGREHALTKLRRLGKRAKEKATERFTQLLVHVKAPLLREAYSLLQKRASAGVDGVTWETYGQGLDERLDDLQDRIHSGRYHPQPVRRVYIPKASGGTRPLGIPALEDKIVQQAVRMVLEPIYEAMFMGFSYGFRPGRSQHNALDVLAVAISRRVNWVLDADIRSFFDTIDHGWMQKFLEHRIGDSKTVRLVMKWMRAGVWEDGQLHEVEEGTPQGGVISPLLANVFLHYVLDAWVQSWRRKHARGDVYIVRYADDFVIGFQYEQDARAMREALSARLERFGLQLHPEKTRVIQFGRFARGERAKRGLRPESFDFLGFTHIVGLDRGGRFQLSRRTSRKKRRAKLDAVKEECRRRRCEPVPEQQAWLISVLIGHYRYYGVPTNYLAMAQFRDAVASTWHRSLQRRSQKGRWSPARYEAFKARFPLPLPKIYHPWPNQRARIPLTK